MHKHQRWLGILHYTLCFAVITYAIVQLILVHIDGLLVDLSVILLLFFAVEMVVTLVTTLIRVGALNVLTMTRFIFVWAPIVLVSLLINYEKVSFQNLAYDLGLLLLSSVFMYVFCQSYLIPLRSKTYQTRPLFAVMNHIFQLLFMIPAGVVLYWMLQDEWHLLEQQNLEMQYIYILLYVLGVGVSMFGLYQNSQSQ